MPDHVIRQGRVEVDRWRFAETADAAPGPIVVSLATWKEHRGALLSRGGALGVWLRPEDDPAELEADLPALELVAVHFPKFTDGRGYSTAALLRRRHGFRGELRAFGDVGRDQLFYLARCGFDSFALPAHRDAQAALAGFGDFTVRYQGAMDDPVPLFRRRCAGAAQ